MIVANADSLLRHRTIDKCMRDRKNRYTLNDLILACRDAFNQQKKGKKSKSKGNDKKSPVSARTIQLDLQFMRDKERGYAAPIVVYEMKYYRYSDPSFSIEKVNIKKNNLEKIEEILSNLKELSNFSEFQSTRSAIKILDEEIGAIYDRRDPVVSFAGKEKPLGLEYFDSIHDGIVNKKVLCIGYYSSRSENIITIIFYPFYLKEYKGRWYAFGYKDGMDGVYKLPLDRIRDLSYSILPFPTEYSFNPDKYFNDIIGVTRLSGKKREIELLVKNRIAPFIKLNPIHHSQRVKSTNENGDMVFTIEIIPNREFYNIIYSNRPYIEILSPRDIGLESNKRIMAAVESLPQYIIEPKSSKGDNINNERYEEMSHNLFSELE